MFSKGHGMKSGIFAAALLSGLAFGTAAQATPIMYQFSAFGSVATGFFTFDAATDQASAISITVSGFGGGPLDGIYTQAGPITPLSTTPVFGTHATDIIVANSGATRQAWIGFAAPLTPAGGEISVFGASNPSAFNEQEAGVDLGSAIAISGVPEPASFAVLGVGILGLVATKRRRMAATPPAPLP
jgi:hypothetical protein